MKPIDARDYADVIGDIYEGSAISGRHSPSKSADGLSVGAWKMTWLAAVYHVGMKLKLPLPR